ncbi:MAG: DUF5615 family PIN-like protein [Candidatus Rokubacteria bacterium]|nr:DUF5615 family PIN-like protein [Candidatus Rokubacteria bacterium]
MRLLADEDCDFAVVEALRAAGHDVMAIVATTRGISDEEPGRVRIGRRPPSD